jgi:hypothetical protein
MAGSGQPLLAVTGERGLNGGRKLNEKYFKATLSWLILTKPQGWK